MQDVVRHANGWKKNGWDYSFNDVKAIPYPDTREYVIKVLHDRDKYYLLYKNKLPNKNFR